MIGFDRFWFSKIRDRILLNDRFRSFIESSIIFKPFIRAQANEIFDLVSGFVYSQILYACVSLDLFEKFPTVFGDPSLQNGVHCQKFVTNRDSLCAKGGHRERSRQWLQTG